MLGLSITGIGGRGRSIATSLSFYEEMKASLRLSFLELAIGIPCDVEDSYGGLPLVLHDSCLYKREGARLNRLYISPLRGDNWSEYKAFVSTHQVLAISVHGPKLHEGTPHEIEKGVARMESYFGIPVLLEGMAAPNYWHHPESQVCDVPTLLDVSHALIWCNGNQSKTEEVCMDLIHKGRVQGIHLSHNNGKSDSHELIPPGLWWEKYLPEWSLTY